MPGMVPFEKANESASETEDVSDGSDDPVTVPGGPNAHNTTDPVEIERLEKRIAELREEQEQDIQDLKGLELQREMWIAKKDEVQKEIEEARAALHEIEHPVWAEVKEKRKKAEKLAAANREAQKELDKINMTWGQKKLELETAVQHEQLEIKQLFQSIMELEASMNAAPPPPGPRCLSWLDGDIYTVIASLVIIANIWMMVMIAIHPELEEHLEWLNELFLIYYVVELILKAIYKQQQLVCGPLSVVWGNWLDIVIVTAGVCESWIAPLFAGDNDSADGTKFLGYLRVLRLARLARVLKIAHVMLSKDVSWAQGQKFQSFMMSVIGINTIIMGMECDIQNFQYWWVVENVLLCIYAFELLVRMKVSGCGFFCNRTTELFWNWLDLIIVVGAVVDQWFMPAIAIVQVLMGTKGGSHFGALGQIFMMLRLVRLLRVLRLAKIIRTLPPLYTLVMGIAQAVQGMSWVMGLALVVLYISALLGVKLVGRPGFIKPHPGDEKVPETITENWDTIPNSMFNLFKVMNADTSGVEELVAYVPPIKWIIMGFMMLTNWAIFSILTAVAGDNMAKVTEKFDNEEKEASRAKRFEQAKEKLDKMFNKIDQNDNHMLEESEFEVLLQDEVACREFLDLTGVAQEDAEDVFKILSTMEDADEEPKVLRTDFLEGLNKESDDVTERSIMRLEKHLWQVESLIQKAQGRPPVLPLHVLLSGKMSTAPQSFESSHLRSCSMSTAPQSFESCRGLR